ncbi:hypothetical protein, partial [Paraburkholderia tagetis]
MSAQIRAGNLDERRTGRCRRSRGRRRISGVENTGKMRHFPQALTIAALPGGVLRPPGQAVLVPAACREQAGPTRVIGALGTAVRLPYAQVKNDFLVLAGCVKADIPTNTAEDLHDDSKTNDHPATP